MIVSWNWLTDYLRLDMPVGVLADRLALAGLNLESISDVEGDIAIDLEVTSNRPDCLGHVGVAREIGVLFEKPMRVADPRPATAGAAVETRTAVTIEEPVLCPRFTARVISGVTVGESPWWLRKRLATIGVRPISNIVDVTNYVMFECGQPLHAYDLERLEGHRLVVRCAKPGETMTAINNRVYELAPEMLVIADLARPVGLAGVMGGALTEIGPSTKHVLVEAAQFDAMSVRRTSRALGLFSPSSFRFERPLDPAGTEWASRRTCELILEVAGGKLHPGVIDVGAHPPVQTPVTFRFAQIERILGIKIERSEVARILEALGLERLAENEHTITVRPPSWRSDLEREIDLVEEVARIHGYHHIPENRSVPLFSAPRGARERVESAVRQILTGAGFDEAVTFSLVDDRLGAAVRPGAPSAPWRVEHSSRKRDSALRQSLIPSLLSVRLHNESHGQFDAELFEIAHVYLRKAPDKSPGGQAQRRADSPGAAAPAIDHNCAPGDNQSLPQEPTRLALVAARDFGGLKGTIEALLAGLHVRVPLESRAAEIPLFAAGRSAELLLGETHLGYLGEIALDELANFELREKCAAAELELDVLLNQANLVAQYYPLPPYPAVVRDLSLVMARALQWTELSEAVRRAAGPTLEAVTYLDTFRGGNIPEDHHSVHFSMTFRHPERTLTGEEIDRAVKTVIAACEDRLGAKLRT